MDQHYYHSIPLIKFNRNIMFTFYQLEKSFGHKFMYPNKFMYPISSIKIQVSKIYIRIQVPKTYITKFIFHKKLCIQTYLSNFIYSNPSIKIYVSVFIYPNLYFVKKKLCKLFYQQFNCNINIKVISAKFENSSI